jgi:hypothetical protein
MLQDAGLALDEIAGVLHAPAVADRKAIPARPHEHHLEANPPREEARGYLAGALLCRFDHPATECHVMGAEIDRRLASADLHPLGRRRG